MKKIMPDVIIGLDFDGTCVTHEFPNIGKELPGCVETLQKIIAHGGKLILWTMRSNMTTPPISTDPTIVECEHGDYLDQAIKWFYDRDITLWGIQENPDQKSWTGSPKAYAHIYIDDAALGCPVTFDHHFAERPYVNWEKIDRLLFPDIPKSVAIIK